MLLVKGESRGERERERERREERERGGGRLTLGTSISIITRHGANHTLSSSSLLLTSVRRAVARGHYDTINHFHPPTSLCSFLSSFLSLLSLYLPHF